MLSWTFGLTLAILLLFEVYQAFFWLDPNPVFGLIAIRSGIGLFEPGLRYVTGALELAAALLLLIPRWRGWGARLAGLVVLGAIGFHLSPWLGIQLPEPVGLSAALAAGRTVVEIDTMNLPADRGAMFILALAILALSVASILTEKAVAKAAEPKPRKPMGAFA
ncbi:MAG: hypothetical protein Q8L66_12190 [Caulobacter sp.]|nr:hypothetical protein [Caulobacter sp.]